MKKAKIVLATICLLASAGGAVAFKARATSGFIFPAGQTVPVTTSANCTVLDYGCIYTYRGSTYQIYTLSSGVYNPVAEI